MNISISFEQATNIPATCLAFIKILQTWRRVSRKPEAKYKAGVGGNVCNVECPFRHWGEPDGILSTYIWQIAMETELTECFKLNSLKCRWLHPVDFNDIQAIDPCPRMIEA